MIGQQELQQDIFNSIIENTFSHAILLVGDEGYGVLPLALEISKFLVCKNSTEKGFCRECNSCKKAAKFIHPDIHFAFPAVSIKDKKRKSVTSVDFLPDWREQLLESAYFDLDAWVNRIATSSGRPDINVTECNQITQQLNLQSFEGGAKVQLIWMAELLGGNGNKLLKLIEEPPANTYIILMAKSDEFILNTIISRCRVIKLGRISDDDIDANLMTKYQISPEESKQISFIAEGDWLSATRYVEYNNDELLNYAAGLIGVSRRGDIIEIRDWVDQFANLDTSSKRAIVSLTNKLLKELLHLKVMGPAMMRLGNRAYELLKGYQLVGTMTVEQIEIISKILSDTDYLISRNINTKVLMYNSCLEIESVFNPSVIVQ